ncbi:Y-family DNA polymerase [Daejeonella lutea]|uniref:Protein ImuB n=1 Tax=Daejeonella lutea TaxID=572036 RepID=A0A1T5EHM5_9SPHI|nr:DNA polymerase Y family protein [Daejeonella lutea]SKB83329.1 protein ImuB [Daejeonella lutea]
MSKRFVAIWFRHLLTDWLALRRPDLRNLPFVIAIKDHGRLLITATNNLAETEGIYPGMLAADAKALVPSLEIIDDIPGKGNKLLKGIGEWCIRYTPIIIMDPSDGLILDISGCAHLWGGEHAYLQEIISRLKGNGYDVRAAIADTIGTAWAVARFGKINPIIGFNQQAEALLSLPPAALRLESSVLERLQKLGLKTISSFMTMPRSVLRRRFGEGILLRLDQALGNEDEFYTSLLPVKPYEERLPSLEPIRTAVGIEIAVQKLLEMLCKRLQQEGKGIRTAVFKGYRIDGKVVQMAIGTNLASHNIQHLYKLFELKISTLEPALGIELFTLEASKVEDIPPHQEALWTGKPGLEDGSLAELLDRLAGKVGAETIHRYLPDEHYWPERSIKTSCSIKDKPSIRWRTDKPRPVQLLAQPEKIDVTAPIPDYPPMLFRYKEKVHHVKKADGPERIEREWWLDAGQHRDYYHVEDQNGQRYWLFRSGHYNEDGANEWFIHGFFA